MALPQQMVDLVPLLRVRQWLNIALAPVRPSAEFRAWLKQELLQQAAQMSQQAPARRLNQLALAPGRRELLIGAAVGSVVSLAGLIILLIKWRLSQRAVHTPAA